MNEPKADLNELKTKLNVPINVFYCWINNHFMGMSLYQDMIINHLSNYNFTPNSFHISATQ